MSLLLALGLCAASSVAYAAGALLQRRLAVHPVAVLARHPWWWFALLLNVAGAALHVAALRFGPLLIVQPLGLLTVVLAVAVAALEKRRPVSNGEWGGLALSCAGLVGLVVVVDAGPANALRPEQLPVLLTACVAVLLPAAVLSRRPRASTLWAAAAGGTSFGVASALAQTLTVEFSTHGLAVAADPMILSVGGAMAVFAGAGTLFTQTSYRRRFGAALATSTLTNPVAAATIGITLLGEGLRGGLAGVLLGLACAAAAAVGITLLAASPDHAPVPRHRRGDERVPGPTPVPDAGGWTGWSR
jgi:drug/metabolite transporter (DMT)-like permease